MSTGAEATFTIPDDILAQAVAAKIFEALTSEDRESIIREFIDGILGRRVHRGTLGVAVPNDNMNIRLLDGLIENLVIEKAREIILGIIAERPEEFASAVTTAFESSWHEKAQEAANQVAGKAVEFALSNRRF